MSIERISTWYWKLPAYDRKLPLVIVDGREYTPNQIYDEVRRGTRLGEKLQRSVELGAAGLTNGAKIWELAKKRLITKLREIPVTVKTYLLGKPEITSEEMIRDIETEGFFGKSLIEAEIEQMKALMEV